MKQLISSLVTSDRVFYAIGFLTCLLFFSLASCGGPPRPERVDDNDSSKSVVTLYSGGEKINTWRNVTNIRGDGTGMNFTNSDGRPVFISGTIVAEPEQIQW